MTAVLEVENKEGLSKLLKMAKIAGIYAKQRLEDEKRKDMRKRALAALDRIHEASVKSGLDKMTLVEINEEIAQARKERAMREKCFA